MRRTITRLRPGREPRRHRRSHWAEAMRSGIVGHRGLSPVFRHLAHTARRR